MVNSIRNLNIFIFIGVLLLSPSISSADNSRLFFSNPPKQIEEGERVTFDINIESKTQPINAISGVVYFPSELLQVVSVSKEKSLINFWTHEPKVFRDKISFEGVILNPGFQGSKSKIFSITFEAKNKGTANLGFTEGSVLANDGMGSNVLTYLDRVIFKIIGVTLKPDTTVPQLPKKDLVEIPKIKKIVKLPIITGYPSFVNSKEKLRLEGEGEPNALTKIVFEDVSVKSIGERFMEFVQTEKKKLDSVLVKNNEVGKFDYVSPSDLLAGVYNATPFLIEEETNNEKPGFGVQLFVKDSKIVNYLIVAINVLGLLIPIVTLCVIVYFIPWYSWRKMRVLKRKLGLEEEKIELIGIDLERQSNQRVDRSVSSKEENILKKE